MQPRSGDDYLAMEGGGAGHSGKVGAACGLPTVARLLLASAVVAAGFVAGHLSARALAGVEDARRSEGRPSRWEPKILPAFDDEPVAKNTVRRFDAFLINQAAFEDPETKLRNVEQWLGPDFVYDAVGFGSSHTPRGWCVDGEETEFRRTFNSSSANQMLFFGTEAFATTTSYMTVFWAQDLHKVTASRRWTYFRVADFYLVRATSPGRGQIYYNLMMVDFADFFNRNGIRVLPKPVLPEGLVLTAEANDGTPAPLSVVARTQDVATAQRISELALEEDWAGTGTHASTWQWHSNLTFYGPGGIGVARGTEQYREHVLRPFREALTDRRAVTSISGCEGNYCGIFGELHGRHIGPWLGLEASGRYLSIRFAFHYHIVGGLILEGWAIFDVPGLFEQLGQDFFAIAGAASAVRLHR